MTDARPGSDVVAEAFATIAATLAAETTMEGLLERVASLAVKTIDPCDMASVMTRTDGQAVTIAASDPLAAQIDEFQFEAGEGPCLDAMDDGVSHYVGDLEHDPRWRRFGPAASAVGINSVLVVPLNRDEHDGVLNFYAELSEAFGAHDRAFGAIFAVHAGLALSHQHRENERDAAGAAQLRNALVTRELIGQAQGILMEREHITASKAFDILREASQHLNVKLRDVAQGVVDTGSDPDTGTR